MTSDSAVSEWFYLSPQSLPPAVSGGEERALQTPSHLKPATEGSVLEEEKEGILPFSVVRTISCQRRLPPPGEESYAPFSSAIGAPRSDHVATDPAFGNSLGVRWNANEVHSVPVVLSVDYASNDSAPNPGGVGTPPSVVLSSNNDNVGSCNRGKLFLDSKVGIKGIAGECLSPTVTPSNAPQFPPEPTVLADRYAILGPVDASTCHGVHLSNHEAVHIKAVTARTAREVCSQQALLDESVGVRAPIEAIVSWCGKRAWLVFPPHYGDLHSYVRLRRRLREAEAQRLFSQVAATVAKCHSSGLVLRDLKLRKFVFTDPNRQRVVLESVEDSVVAGEMDLLHDKHGCPAYVAPEILSSAAYSGRHADMWGLGVILYTMLVGRYPFHNADTSALFAKIRSGKFFVPEWVSSRARHLILSLLRRQPHRRLSARQVLLHPWINRSPRDHVGKDPQDHIVPTDFSPAHVPAVGKARLP